MAIIGGFYVLTLFLGFGAARFVGPAEIAAVDAGGNMAAPLLAQYLGGGPDSFLGNLMLAFVSAVAFATIVAVVAGLVLAASSALAHDLYVGVLRAGESVTPQEQVKAARVATVDRRRDRDRDRHRGQGPERRASLVALAFAVAASANFPCVLLTLYWKRCNTAGIVAGMIVGTTSAVGLTLVSPNLTYPLVVTEAAQKVLAAEPARRESIATALASGEAAIAAKARRTRRARQGRRQGEERHREARRPPHVVHGPREAADRAQEPRHRLDPARLPVGDPVLADVPRPARGRHVERGVRAPEHGHPRVEGERALTPRAGRRRLRPAGRTAHRRPGAPGGIVESPAPRRGFLLLECRPGATRVIACPHPN
jgi:hypothetical protein